MFRTKGEGLKFRFQVSGFRFQVSGSRFQVILLKWKRAQGTRLQ